MSVSQVIRTSNFQIQDVCLHLFHRVPSKRVPASPELSVLTADHLNPFYASPPQIRPGVQQFQRCERNTVGQQGESMRFTTQMMRIAVLCWVLSVQSCGSCNSLGSGAAISDRSTGSATLDDALSPHLTISSFQVNTRQAGGAHVVAVFVNTTSRPVQLHPFSLHNSINSLRVHINNRWERLFDIDSSYIVSAWFFVDQSIFLQPGETHVDMSFGNRTVSVGVDCSVEVQCEGRIANLAIEWHYPDEDRVRELKLNWEGIVTFGP